MEMQLMIPSPTITTTTTPTPYDDNDFAFDFSRQLLLDPPSISAADELFHCGKIRPLNPYLSPPSKFTEEAVSISPRCNPDSFTVTFNRTSADQTKTTQKRFRISDILSGEEDTKHKNYNKWSLKSMLLFRSASEGSVRRRKEPVNKYSRIRKDDDVKNFSFRKSTDDCRSEVGVGRRRVMRKVSAHEIHYTVNRAVAEEMRRKTSLPYKSGLLGCLGFLNDDVGR